MVAEVLYLLYVQFVFIYLFLIKCYKYLLLEESNTMGSFEVIFIRTVNTD